MTKTICITIDTEPDCDIHWKRSNPVTFESVTFGIPEILRPIWDEFGIRPVYFVSPEVAANDECCDALKKEMKLGAEIAAHLHSEYIGPEQKHADVAGTSSKEYPCYAYDTAVEAEKIKNLTEMIEKKFGTRPVSYRAARYGADLNTIKSLEQLGYKVDSSVTPQIDWSGQGGPNHTSSPKQPYFVSADDLYSPGDSKILEVPITISKKRFPYLSTNWLLYRWLRPTHMTAFEMKLLIAEFERNYDQPILNMMFHSMEVIPRKTPFVRTKLGQKLYLGRLTKIIRHLMRLGYESKTLEAVYDEKLRLIPKNDD